MVGLNFSVSKDAPRHFFNFHGKGGGAFKIRYAFKDSAYYGAYMTDIIKLRGEVDSKKMMQHLKAHPDVDGTQRGRIPRRIARLAGDNRLYWRSVTTRTNFCARTWTRASIAS